MLLMTFDNRKGNVVDTFGLFSCLCCIKITKKYGYREQFFSVDQLWPKEKSDMEHPAQRKAPAGGKF